MVLKIMLSGMVNTDCIQVNTARSDPLFRVLLTQQIEHYNMVIEDINS